MLKGKEYKLEKDLNTEYLKKCNLTRYFQESKIPNWLTKYSTDGVLKGQLLNKWERLKVNMSEFFFMFSLYLQQSPFTPRFTFHGFSYPQSVAIWEQMVLHLTSSQKVCSSLMLHHNDWVIHLTLSHQRHFITSYYHKKGE